MDPFCLLTAMDEKSNNARLEAILNVFTELPNLMKDSKKITWINFASDNLGLSVLRLTMLLEMLKHMTSPPSLEIVLIDKRYTQAMHELHHSEPENYEAMDEYIMHQVTLGTLKQFFEFVSAKSPAHLDVSICVNDSSQHYIQHCKNRKNSDLGSCFLLCDDIWEDHCSATAHHSHGAVKDLDHLKEFCMQHAKNGKYILVTKDDFKSVATLREGDFNAKSETTTTLHSDTFAHLQKK
jgi:hypothetical protein